MSTASPIRSVHAEEIADSRGTPTLRVCVETETGKGEASVPSGASTGSHEAKELRDGDPSAHGGRGVQKAIANVNRTIADALRGEALNQRGLDALLCSLDGTPDKSLLGGNAILGVSMAFARAAAAEKGDPLYAYLAAIAGQESALPCPMFNVINGGKHADSGLDIQEFLLVPAGIAGTQERLQAGRACGEALKKILEARGESTAMGDEGGYAPHLSDNEAALEALAEARAAAGYSAQQVRISLDAAASSFVQPDGAYRMKAKAHPLSAEELCDWWAALTKKYDMLSLEDPFAENDPGSFAALQARTSSLIVGDDLTVTQSPRIKEAARAGAIRAVILKPNQVGTVTEAVEAALEARNMGLTLIASHRSGETMDPFIADFAAGLGCEYLKAGALTRPERIAKYNRLTEIAASLHAS